MTTITFPLGHHTRVRARCDDDATWHVESTHELSPQIERMLNALYGAEWRTADYEPYPSFHRARAAAKELKGVVVSNTPPLGMVEMPPLGQRD